MHSPAIDPALPHTWPSELGALMEDLRPVFRAWELGLPERSAPAFDSAMETLGRALLPYSVRGYHFTRLTTDEASGIRENGLDVLSLDLIGRRISKQVAEGKISESQASRLLQKNQARETNRSGMAWFCFYPAIETFEGGVRPLLENWGGEALYNFNKGDEELGLLFKSIGQPALIEALVPATYLPNTSVFASAVYRADLASQGMETDERPGRFEHYSTQSLAPHMIRQVLLHPNPDFVELVGCNQWTRPLN